MPAEPKNKALIASVTALAALAMIGGCLVLAGDGFTASGKRGQHVIFVPLPQAYIMAAILFALSVVAVLWLLQQAKTRAWGYAVCAMAYVGVAFLVTIAVHQALQ